MGSSRLTARTRHFALLALTAAALIAPAAVAGADTRPPSATTPVTVSTDVLPTTQINGVVWSQAVAGKTVFAGGNFTAARPAGTPASSAQASPRGHLVAYHIETGALLPFAPKFNGQVRSLAVSPDEKRLYVGGHFTAVGGVPRNRLAAFDIATGSLLPFNPNANSQVYGLAVTPTTVYAVGAFTSVGGQARKHAAALNPSTGAVLPFKANPGGGTVRQVVVSPDGMKVVLGGSFTSMNGSNRPGYGLALLNASTGANLVMPVNSLIRNAGADAAIMSLVGTKDAFYGSGYRFTDSTGNLEGAFKADWNGNLIWVEDCHGDTYGVAVGVSDVYVAGHPHDCSPMGGYPDTSPPQHHRALAFTAARTGTVAGAVSGYYDYRGKPAPTLLHWHPDLNAGTFTGQSQGPWTVNVSGNYVLYGGEFTRVNGVPQQGLVRFARPSVSPNTDGPVLGGSALALTATNAGAGAVSLSWRSSWDRDNVALTYELKRDGVVVSRSTANSTFWNRPTLRFTDRSVPRGARTYQVRAVDPFLNSKTSSSVSITVP